MLTDSKLENVLNSQMAIVSGNGDIIFVIANGYAKQLKRRPEQTNKQTT